MLYVVCYPLYAEVQPGNLSTLVNLSTDPIVKTITIKMVKIVEVVENYKTADRDKIPE